MSPRPFARVARSWAGLGAAKRRRIVLGSLVALSIAARDVLLFGFTASLLALSEAAPATRASARPA